MSHPGVDPEALARQLAGLREGRTAGTGLTAEHPGLDLEGAYAVQEAGVRLLVAAGERPAGYKRDKMEAGSPQRRFVYFFSRCRFFLAALKRYRYRRQRPQQHGACEHEHTRAALILLLGTTVLQGALGTAMIGFIVP